MAIAFRDAAQNDSNSSNSLDVSVSSLSGLADDDIIICQTFHGGNSNAGTITWPTGFTEIHQARTTSGRDMEGGIAWKRASSESGTYTTSHGGSADQFSVIFTAWSGCTTSGNPLDVTFNSGDSGHYATGENDYNPDGGQLETNTDGAEVLSILFVTHDDITGSGPPSGFTMRDELYGSAKDHRQQFISSATKTTAGTGGNANPGVWTNTASLSDSEWRTYCIALKPDVSTSVTADAPTSVINTGVGTVTVSGDASVTLTGAETAAEAGTVSVTGDANVALTGAETPGEAGTLTVTGDASLTLTGAETPAEAGTVIGAIPITASLTGAEVAAEAGTVTGLSGLDVPLTGAEVAAEAGTVSASADAGVDLTGAEAAAEAGTMTVSTTGGGFSGTSELGLFGTPWSPYGDFTIPPDNVTVTLTGAQITTQWAEFTESDLTQQPDGAEVSAQAGTVTVLTDSVAVLTGAEVSAEAGSVGVSETVLLTGAEVRAEAGFVVALEAAGDAVGLLYPGDVLAQAGTVTAGTDTVAVLTGTEIAAEAGTLDVSPETAQVSGAEVKAEAGTVTASGSIAVLLETATVRAQAGFIFEPIKTLGVSLVSHIAAEVTSFSSLVAEAGISVSSPIVTTESLVSHIAAAGVSAESEIDTAAEPIASDIERIAAVVSHINEYGIAVNSPIDTSGVSVRSPI